VGLPAVAAPAVPKPSAPADPTTTTAAVAALMQKLAPYGRDPADRGFGATRGFAPSPVSSTAGLSPQQRAHHPGMVNTHGVAPSGSQPWEGIPVNFPRARGVEDVGQGIFLAGPGFVAPGIGTAFAAAKRLAAPERQFRSLGPFVPGIDQTSQAMRAHWQGRGAIDARGNVVRGGYFDPDGDGVYDSPAYRGQFDVSMGKQRSPWRQAPGGPIGTLVNAATGEVRRAPSVAELAARTRAISAAPRVATGRSVTPGGVALAHAAAAARNDAAASVRSGSAQRRDDFAARGGGPSHAGAGASRGGRSALGPRGRQGAR
jgi:hypothetical protein